MSKEPPKTPETSSGKYRVTGMDCAEEVAILKREIGPLVGGAEHLAFDVLQGVLTVLPTASDPGSDKLIEAIARTGMSAQRLSPTAERNSASPGPMIPWRTLTTWVSGLLLGLAVLVHGWQAGSFLAGLGIPESDVPYLSRTLYVLASLAGAWHIAPKCLYALRRLRPDMNLLMIVAVAGAIAIGEWLEAATVAFLFSLSLLLETWSVGRARRAVAALMDLAPPTVTVITSDGQEQIVAPSEVEIGTTFLVKPGERIPLDGVLVSGLTDVNQAPITGESALVRKSVGSDLFAGTINGDGAITAQSSKPADQSTLARIIRLVGDAQARKAPSEQWVEGFARIYTPIVMVLAILVLVVPPLLLNQPWDRWMYSSLVLLVIACPCALVISTPVSIVSALASAARHGVLIKGGLFVEIPSQLRAIAVDKTGTLTQGRPSVVEVVPLAGHTESELMQRAMALESRSAHPLATAIVRYAQDLGLKPLPADDVQIMQGKGVFGQFNGKQFWLGSHRFLEERGQETPEMHARLNDLASTGRSVVVVGNESHVCGFIALSDQIRTGVRDIIRDLRQLGVAHVIMLTGDNAATATTVADQLGILEVQSELLPEDKIAAIERLVEEYGSVAMIGDGVNDAPALARATLGIAMGAVGTDAAIETADIALMTDDLSKLPWLIRHSRRALAIIRQNIAFSLTVKLLFAILTLFGLASLWSAIAADTGATLIVIANGLRLLNASDKM